MPIRLRMARAYLELDVEAVAENVRAIRRTVAGPGARPGPDADVVAVVKADGYGHGATAVGRAALAGGAAGLAVATADEAVRLRDAGVTAPIQLLGPFLDDELEVALKAGAAVTVAAREDLDRVRRTARRLGRRAGLHVKVDVGMHRHGCAPELAVGLLADAAGDPALRTDGLMTHLPSPGDEAATTAQLARFDAVVAAAGAAGLRPPRVHAAASAALFLRPASRHDRVRAGIALLGLDPDQRIAKTGTTLRPALALRAAVLRVLRVPAGDPVGYGGRWTATRDTTVALVGAGYADGVPYGLTGTGAELLLAGRRCPLIGTVMMDYLLVDVTDLPVAPTPGDVATLFGRDGEATLDLVEQAKRANIIPYALSCGLGARLERRLVGRAAIDTPSLTFRRAA